ncbi:hypothetical protein K443DRAFT_38541, partial [Laccaria amethystina LaAM-08-1]
LLYPDTHSCTPIYAGARSFTPMHAKNLTGVPRLHAPARSWHAESVVPALQ